MKHKCIPFVIVLFILTTITSCIIDIPKEIIIDTNPFNNLDNEGNTQLEQGSELIILIPDIQKYTNHPQNHPILESIINRTIEINQLRFKVKAVVQVGDVTDTNTPYEWEIAQKIFSKLGKEKIPYILTTGNHDYGDLGTLNSRQTYFNDFFDFSSQSSFKQCYLAKYYENSLFEIELQGQPLQIITLEFGPSKAIIDWADKILDKDKNSLLVTHAYLFKDKERYNWSQFGNSQNISPYSYTLLYKSLEDGEIDVNDGEDIWQKLIYPSKNIRFIMCGHKTKPDYVGNLISENIEKKDVLQMLFNTQDFPNGGDGWIQILEFKNDKKTVEVKTYSSLYNKWNTGSGLQYQFIYNANEY